MKILLMLTLLLSAQTSVLFAQETSAVLTEPVQKCEEAVTFFQDVSGFGRKDRAAKAMTERHAEMALEGWRFIGLEVYTENGDLEGFFLSYVRAAACPATAEN